MRCSKCGNDNMDGASRCSTCGNELTSDGFSLSNNTAGLQNTNNINQSSGGYGQDTVINQNSEAQVIDGGGMIDQRNGSGLINQQNSNNLANQQNVIENIRAIDQQKKKSHKGLVIAMVLLIVTIAVVAVILWLILFNGNNEVSGEINRISYIKDENGRVKFIDGKFTDVKVTDETSAINVLSDLGRSLGYNNVAEELKDGTVTENEGLKYYRFHQYYKDLKVYGNDVILSVNKSNDVLSAGGYYYPEIEIDTAISKSEEEVKEMVSKVLGEGAEVWSSEKAIMIIDNVPNLIYSIDAANENEADQLIFDARNGELLFKSDLMDNADVEKELKGIDEQIVAVQLFNKNEDSYELRDSERNITVVDASSLNYSGMNKFYATFLKNNDPMMGTVSDNSFIYNENGASTGIANVGVTTLDTFEKIYDYYVRLGRKGFDDKNGKTIVNIDVKKVRDNDVVDYYDNAAWNSTVQQFFIGRYDGISFSICKDVLMHEFTHAVDNHSANLIKNASSNKDIANETGALKEAYADIIGLLFKGTNWLVCDAFDEPIRNLEDPNAEKTPNEKGGKYYYPDSLPEEYGSVEAYLELKDCSDVANCDDGFVHQNATVVGHAAYLMSKNGAFRDYNEMAKIWYNSLLRLPEHANFEDCALAVIKTAENFALSPESVQKIKRAFYDTKMLTDYEANLSGVVKTKQAGVVGATVELTKNDDSKDKYTFTSDENGEFSGQMLSGGEYTIVVNREGFASYTDTVTIVGDTHLEIILSYERDEDSAGRPASCINQQCHMIKIFEEGASDNQYSVYYVVDGEAIGEDELDRILESLRNSDFIKNLGSGFGGVNLSRKGNKVYVNILGMSIPISYYYRGTNEEFDWDSPITEDIDLEVRVGGLSSDFDFLGL